MSSSSISDVESETLGQRTFESQPSVKKLDTKLFTQVRCSLDRLKEEDFKTEKPATKISPTELFEMIMRTKDMV